MEWLEYLELEKNHHTKLDWYLAQIASWICKVNTDKPKEVQVKDFLLEFRTAEEQEKEQSLEETKNIWAASLGINLPKK